MTGESTSPAEGSAAALDNAGGAREEWRNFAAFLKRPVLPEAIAPAGRGLKATLQMVGLDLIIMSAIIAALMAIVALGIELPENLNATLDLDLVTIALIVIAAPLLEESVFRSWLTGRPGFLAAFAILGLAGVVAGAVGVSSSEESARLAIGLALLSGLALAILALLVLRRKATPQWFRLIFPGLFWASSAAFALVHLLNYTDGALAVLLPLVIPQFILGMIAAYVRVHYGLWNAVLLHALHNGFAISLALIAMESGMTA